MHETSQASDLLQVLRSRSLSSAVHDEIERRILSGALRSGQRINENRLAGELGVSRGPIREACRGLVEGGLLTVIVNRGFFVRSITLKDAEDVYDVRASLMRLAGATLAARITPSQMDQLRELVANMDLAEAAEDFDMFYALNREFSRQDRGLRGKWTGCAPCATGWRKNCTCIEAAASCRVAGFGYPTESTRKSCARSSQEMRKKRRMPSNPISRPGSAVL